MENQNNNRQQNNKESQERLQGQLQSLLLLISETNYDCFSLMSETDQKAVLSLAYDLSTSLQKPQ